MKALVTGATGFIGSHLTRALLRRGDSVRILVRSASRAAPHAAAGAQVVVGDLGEPSGLSGLTDGIDVVFHLVSAISATGATFERVDVQGTGWLLDAAERAGVRRFVYPGTLSSYDLTHIRDGAMLDERSPFDHTGLLGNYAQAKARAERAVLAAHRRRKLEGVILRLGLTCGPGATPFPAHVGRLVKSKWLLMFGDGSLPLPLLLVDNAVDALLLAASTPAAAGEAFNIVDDEVLTQDDYLALFRESTGSLPRVVKLPRLAYYGLGALTELAARARKREPATTPYRVRSRLRRVQWDCSKAHQVLQWQSRIPLREGLRESFLSHAAAAEPRGREAAAH
jgi:nucleoside-diphosphate-sugar epimerase